MVEILGPSTGQPYVIVLGAAGQSLLSIDPDTVLSQFMKHGAVLLRGFACDLETFRQFAERHCVSSVFNESPDRQLLDAEHQIQSVNGGTDAFPLHPELSREPWKPDACFFCCLSPPSRGGQTTICDGIALVEALPDNLRDALTGRRLLYVQPASPEQLAYWLGTSDPSDAQLSAPPVACPYRFRRAGQRIVRAFTRPVLHQPLFDDRPAFGNFLLFARYLLGRPNFPLLDDGQPVPEPWVVTIKQIADRLTVPIAWQQGDLLMLDNSRFMHGRTEILDAEERLIASYFGYLKAAPVNPEEPADPLWRRMRFTPPRHPGNPGGRAV